MNLKYEQLVDYLHNTCATIVAVVTFYLEGWCSMRSQGSWLDKTGAIVLFSNPTATQQGGICGLICVCSSNKVYDVFRNQVLTSDSGDQTREMGRF